MEGLFITFEGIEGAGKTTQLRMLAGWLTGRGFRVIETSEPDGTPLGKSVRALFEQSGLAPTPVTGVLRK